MDKNWGSIGIVHQNVLCFNMREESWAIATQKDANQFVAKGGVRGLS